MVIAHGAAGPFPLLAHRQRGSVQRQPGEWVSDTGSALPARGRGIGVVEGTVSEVLINDDQLTGVQMDDGHVIPRDALFVPSRFVPNNDLLVGLGCDLDERGWVVTGANGATSVAGVWVAGNLANPRARVITAAGEGSAAAIAINADLVDEDVAHAVRDYNCHGILT